MTTHAPLGTDEETGLELAQLSRHDDLSSPHEEKAPVTQQQETPGSMPFPESDLGNGIVGWDGQDDPENPRNFTFTRRWTITGLLSAIAFLTPFASSVLAPAISFIGEDYGVSDGTLSAMPVSIFLLGYAVGPLVLSPLSEIYGRHVTLTIASASFCIWLLGCAVAPNLVSLIILRFLCGVGGSASQTIGGAVIADLFPVEERGRAIAIWTLGPIFGPSIAPLMGAFVAESIGWRWLNWITFIPSVVAVAALFLFNRETHHQTLIRRKTERLRKELNRPDLRSCYVDGTTPSPFQVLLNGLLRPIKLLFRSVAIFAVSLYIAFIYGCLYLLFNTIPPVFQEKYGWSVGITGIVYLALMVGYLISLAIFYYLSDSTIIRLTKANGGVYQAEMRLATCLYFAVLLAASFFLYGWTADKSVHWFVPVFGLVLFAIGFDGIWLPAQAYVVDAYSSCSASALAAFMVMRSLVAAFLPFGGPKMYESLGVGWGTSVLGFIALGLIPIPVLLGKYGGKIRAKEKLGF